MQNPGGMFCGKTPSSPAEVASQRDTSRRDSSQAKEPLLWGAAVGLTVLLGNLGSHILVLDICGYHG